jgi:hypothetical protein
MKNQALVLYPKYGLANRLRAIASAKILADYTGRKLFINWIPSSECNIEWEKLFVNQIQSYPLPLSSFKAGVNLYDDSRNYDGFYWRMPKALVNNKSDIVAVHTCSNFQLKEMTNEAFMTSKSLFYKSLQPVSAVQKIVSDIQEQYLKTVILLVSISGGLTIFPGWEQNPVLSARLDCSLEKLSIF